MQNFVRVAMIVLIAAQSFVDLPRASAQTVTEVPSIDCQYSGILFNWVDADPDAELATANTCEVSTLDTPNGPRPTIQTTQGTCGQTQINVSVWVQEGYALEDLRPSQAMFIVDCGPQVLPTEAETSILAGSVDLWCGGLGYTFTISFKASVQGQQNQFFTGCAAFTNKDGVAKG